MAYTKSAQLSFEIRKLPCVGFGDMGIVPKVLHQQIPYAMYDGQLVFIHRWVIIIKNKLLCTI